MTEPDDTDLVARAQNGDREAMDTLLRRHYDRIFAVCRRIAGNTDDALDATQEALLALVRGISRYDGRASFSTWSYRVATNACLDELRRRKRRPEPVEPEVVEAPSTSGGSQLEDQVTARIDVDAALAGLSPEFRAAVTLRDLAGLEYAEISEVLGVPIGTVRSRIARGRAAVAEAIEGNRPGSGERQREQR